MKAAAFDPRRVSPSTLFLAMSTSHVCNFRCKMCHIWLNTDELDGLTVDERVAVIRQFAALNPHGIVEIPGGEVTMDLPQLFALANACKEEGLPCIIVTNGSHVTDDEIAREIATSGITYLCVSLDSHVPEVYEYMRGMPGGFEQTIRAVQLLLKAKAGWNPNLVVVTSAVLCSLNLERLDDYVDFCRGLGVDHVNFQLLAATFANRSRGRDFFFEKYFWHDPAAKRHAQETLQAFFAEARDDGFLIKDQEDAYWIQRYIDEPGFKTQRPMCASHERNLMVDSTGNVSLCFNASLILADPCLGNVKDGDLRSLWVGEKARAHRHVMDECRLSCGTLNCHRKDRSEAAHG